MQAATKELLTQLDAARTPIVTKTYNPNELLGLPEPVQKYFRAVLKEWQPMVLAVSLKHFGTFNMSETAEKWRPFTSTQRVITQRPGFDWESRIAILPGLSIRLHDAYIAGEGILHASLFEMVPLVNLRGRQDVAQGELMRFLAEATWYPTALLPSQGVQWEPIDGVSAKATLRDGETTVTLLFLFNEKGIIESVRSEARGRTVAGAVIPTPWEGRWSKYELHNGMLIPTEGEVSWILTNGTTPYWRGRIMSLNYEFAK